MQFDNQGAKTRFSLSLSRLFSEKLFARVHVSVCGYLPREWDRNRERVKNARVFMNSLVCARV